MACSRPVARPTEQAGTNSRAVAQPPCQQLIKRRAVSEARRFSPKRRNLSDKLAVADSRTTLFPPIYREFPE